ncbi:MAG: hypothetical protein V5A55_09005 [Halovenus sp.]
MCEPNGGESEAILLRLDGEVIVPKNSCVSETDQHLDRGCGAAVRDGGCPKHGATFDGRTGH